VGKKQDGEMNSPLRRLEEKAPALEGDRYVGKKQDGEMNSPLHKEKRKMAP
jgi:hypothetical protein